MRSLRLIFCLLLLVIMVLAVPASAQARDLGEILVKEKSQGPLLLSGTRVTTEADITGDVYLIGEEINIRGNVTGDVFCLAQKVTIDGKVEGDIRLVAAEMELNAPCTGSVTALGNSFWLWQEASSKNMFLATGSAQLNGKVDGSLRGQTDTIYINGMVSGKTDMRVNQQLSLGPRAVLQGGLTYESPTKLRKEKGAAITGEPQYKLSKKPENSGINPTAVMISWLSALVIWWVARIIRPTIWQSWGSNLAHHPWVSLFLGGLTILLLPPLLLLLIFSVIGLPAAVILLAMLLTVGYLGRVVVAVGFSLYLVQGARVKPGIAIMIALIPLVLLTYIPNIGTMFALTYACLGLGSLLYTLRAGRRETGFDQVV